jgi:alpha-beta hydrolase superfamily lysophospholipase
MRRLARRAGFCAGGLFALFFLTAFGLALVPAPARGLRAEAGAEVYRLDLRDHGSSASRPRRDHLADLDHVGQYEEDVADVLALLRREHPGAPLVLAGHSMGGGIALRYLARPELHAGAEADGLLLYAPLLSERAPTARKAPASGGEAGGPSLIRVALPRIVGLAMLELVRFRALGGLGTLYFDLPADLPVRAYSFRAMASMAPEDYAAALRAGSQPLLAIAGEGDEAFHAAAYPGVIALHPQGKTVLVPGAGHDGVLSDPRSVAAAGAWLRSLAPRR